MKTKQELLAEYETATSVANMDRVCELLDAHPDLAEDFLSIEDRLAAEDILQGQRPPVLA